MNQTMVELGDVKKEELPKMVELVVKTATIKGKRK